MRCIVVGYGVQGRKRAALAGRDLVATVDPMVAEAGLRRIAEVPDADYDAALLCTPDGAKLALIEDLLSRGKSVLVEKPLLLKPADLDRVEALARDHGAICYTAYNHRFEPHCARLKAILDEGRLGRLYHCRLFYGNGTARDVRNSPWRDQGAGVLPDLGSHLIDLARWWFGDDLGRLRLGRAQRCENQAFDHVTFGSDGDAGRGVPSLDMETTLLSWRNHFQVDLFAEKGSVHIAGLCKWGPSSITVRDRVLPSGRPDEHTETLVQADPTWALEYDWFKRLVAGGRQPGSSLDNDRAIAAALDALAAEALGPAGAAA